MCDNRKKPTGTPLRSRILTILALLTIPLLAASCAGRGAAGKGDDYFQQGLYDLAVEQYRLALAEKPDSAKYREKLELATGRAAKYHFERGRKLLTENRLKDAAAAFDTAVEYRPDHSEAKEAYDAAIRLLTQLTLDIENGRKLLAEKKWFDAIERLAKVRNYPADFPEAGAAYDEAVDGAFNSLMSEGIEAYREERFDEALETFTRALQLKPKDAGVVKMIDSTRRHIRAIENYRTGEALLKGGDFRRAIAEFQTSLLLVPGYAKASDGLARAKRLGAEILSGEGRAALKEKKFATAVAALNEAAGYAPDMEGLAEDARKARRSLAGQLYERGRRYERTKSPALAYLCFRMAGELDPGIAGLGDALSAAQTSISAYRSYAVFLAGEDKDGNLGRRVLTGSQRALSGTGASVFGPEEAKVLTQRNPGLVPDAVLTISQGAASINHHTPRVQRKSVRYLASTRTIAVPYYTGRPPHPSPLRGQRPPSTGVDDRNRSRRRYDDRTRRDPEPHRGPRHVPHGPDPYRSYRLVTVREYATYTYDIVTNRITGRMTATYRVVDTLLGNVIFSGTVAAEHSDTDRVVQGHQKAGVGTDPDELMTTDEMRDYLEDKLASRLASAVGGALRGYPKRYLDFAEKAKAAGGTDMWLNNLALYILTGGDDSEQLRRIDALLRENIGYSLRARQINYAALKKILEEG